MPPPACQESNGNIAFYAFQIWAQLLLEQVREAESEQALDRLRLLRGEGKETALPPEQRAIECDFLIWVELESECLTFFC